MRESPERSASGGGDAARTGSARTGAARTDAAREWLGARAAGRVVLALIAVALLLATWAMSPGLFTRQIEARLGPNHMWSVAWTGGTQESGAWLDTPITGTNARVGIAAWAERIEIRRFTMLGLRNGEGAFDGALVERVAGVQVRGVTLREGVTEVGGRRGAVLVIRVGACVMVIALMAALVWLVKGGRQQDSCVEEIGTGRTSVPRDGVGMARMFGAVPICVIAIWTLASPAMMCPDSVDYVANAMRLMDAGSFAHFDGWRSPGYSLVLLCLLPLDTHIATAAGVLNVLMVIATMLLAASACGWLVREATGNARGSERLAAWAGAAVMWVIGLDPWVMLWTRHVMPECASMLVVAVVVRVLVGVGLGRARGHWRDLAIAATLGLFIGAACYLRGNFQLLVACVPVCLGVCVLARGAGWWRAVMVGGACAVCGVGSLMPWVVRTHARTGEWSFTTGGQFAKALFAQETGLMDWNQSDAFEVQHLLRLAQMRDTGTLGAYPFVHEMNTGRLAALGDPNLPQLVNTDRRARVMVEESLARRPAMRNVLALKAMSTQLGVWPFNVPGYRENAYWAGALRGSEDRNGPTGGDNQWADPMTQSHLPWDVVQRVHAQTTRPIATYRQGAVARGFDAWWKVGSVTRMVLAWLGVLGVAWVVLRLARVVLFSTRSGAAGERDAAADAKWVRGAVCVILIAGLVAAHGAAIAWVVMTGLDRYAVAMIPASAVVCVAMWAYVWACAQRGASAHATHARSKQRPHRPREPRA